MSSRVYDVDGDPEIAKISLRFISEIPLKYLEYLIVEILCSHWEDHSCWMGIMPETIINISGDAVSRAKRGEVYFKYLCGKKTTIGEFIRGFHAKENVLALKNLLEMLKKIDFDAIVPKNDDPPFFIYPTTGNSFMYECPHCKKSSKINFCFYVKKQ